MQLSRVNAGCAACACLLAAAAFLLAPIGAFAQVQNAGQEHWVTTWATSPQQARAPQVPGPPPAAAPRKGFDNQTIRMIARTSIGGRRLRVRFSNAFGAVPVTIGSAHVALRDKESAIVPASDRALTFNGEKSCRIPAGALIVSDPVDLEAPPLSDVAISLFLPSGTGAVSGHNVGLHTSYISKGDAAGQASMPDAITSQSSYWLSSMEVLAPADAAVIVALGDSITDGARSTPDTYRNWPGWFSQRLLANPGTANVAIANEGISGNRVLHDGVGQSALARFDRDVLGQSGAKWVVLLEGINDIRAATRDNAAAGDMQSSGDVIAGLYQLVERAHAAGLKVIGGTLTPYGGSMGYNDTGEAMRQAVNRWIRTSGAFDAVLDFDAVARDPNDPTRIRADFSADDHLHPNDEGYKALADSIDLAIFGPKSVTAQRSN